MEKSIIRKRILDIRKNADNKQLKNISEKITNNLFEYIDFKKYNNFYLYSSTPGEVDTNEIINILISHKKNVALPKVLNDQNSVMDFFRINDIKNDLSEGYFGINEPDIRICSKEELRPDVIILPGVAFDNKCNRIGYGRGFYDKYISDNRLEDTLKIALAYDFQIIEPDIISTDAHDISMNLVITESRIIKNE